MSAWLRQQAGLRQLVYLTAAAVAAFAFIVSYAHIYDLGQAHAQHGIAARLLPLSVDLLIIAASLVLFIQSSGPRPETWLACWLPRIVLWAGIGATVAANVAYGLPHGWLAAVISGWPGAAFVGVVEMVMVTVRPSRDVPAAVPPAANRPRPLPSFGEIRDTYGCSQATAEKIRKAMRTRDRVAAAAPEDAAGAPATPREPRPPMLPDPGHTLNGDGPHA